MQFMKDSGGAIHPDIIARLSQEGLVQTRFVHMSFSSDDAMHVTRFREQITKVMGYDNTELVPPTVADSGWLVNWTEQLNDPATAAVVILDTKSYREKLAHSNSPLRREAHAILAAKNAKPSLKIYVLNPTLPEQGCTSVRALLLDDIEETNFIGYKKWLHGQGVRTGRQGSSDSIATKVFDIIDTNGNGKLSKTEVVEFCQEHKINLAKFNRQLKISDSHHMQRSDFVAAYDRGDLTVLDLIDFEVEHAPGFEVRRAESVRFADEAKAKKMAEMQAVAACKVCVSALCCGQH